MIWDLGSDTTPHRSGLKKAEVTQVEMRLQCNRHRRAVVFDIRLKLGHAW